MNNNFFPNYACNQQVPTYGYNYQQQQMPAFNNLISDEQAKMIANEGNGLNIARTPIETARAMCTHKYPNRGAAITQRSDGLWQCAICGTVMNILDMTTEEVTDIVATMTDIIHNIKLFIPSINPEIGRTLYQALDLVETVPSLWEYASEYKNKYFNLAGSNNYSRNYGQNTINQLYSLTNPTQFGMGGYGMMGVQPQQPGYFGQPMGMGMQQPPQAPMMGQTPMGAPTPGMYSNQQQSNMMAPAQPITGGVINPNPNDRPVGVVSPTPMVQQTGVATAGPAPQPTPEKVQKNFKS